MKTTGLIWIILGVIIGGVILGVVFFSGQQQEVVGGCSGGQVLSIDDVNIRYSNDLQKDVVRVVFSTVPTSECLDIYLSPSAIESYLEDNGITDFDAQNSIMGDIDLVKKNKVYNIIENQNEKYFKIGIDNTGDSETCTNSGCSGEVGESCWASLFNDYLFNDCTCFYDDQKGIGGYFQSSTQLQWETNIKIGSYPTLTLSNSKLSGKIGNVAFVKWAGNLAGNVDLQSIDKDIYKPFSNNQFRMVDDGNYDYLTTQYNLRKNALISADGGALAIGDQVITDAYGYNSLFDERTQNDLNQWISQEPLVDDAEIIGNQLIADLASPIVYPQFTLDIDADEIGIFISVGEPEVTCPSDFSIISGDTEQATIKLKNIGDNSASFDYELDCTKGSQTLSPVPPIQLAQGYTKNIIATAGMIVEEGTETSDCTFTARELNTGEEDSCTFSYTSTHQSQCIEGTKSCEMGNTELWICLSDGSYNKISCQYGCEFYNGDYRCRLQANEDCDNGIDDDGDNLIDLDDPDCQTGGNGCGCWISLPLGGGCLIPDLWCHLKNLVNQIILIVSIILGFLGGLLAGLLTNKISAINKKPLEKKWWILGLVFIIVGLAIAYLAYLYWYLALLFVVVVAIFKWVIPGL